MNRHILSPLLASLLLVSFAACTDDGESARETCIAHCEYIGASEGCPDSVANEDVAECKQGCGTVLELWSDDCVVAAEELWLCSMSELTYQCDSGDDQPYSTDEGCEAEFEAFGLCMAGGS